MSIFHSRILFWAVLLEAAMNLEQMLFELVITVVGTAVLTELIHRVSGWWGNPTTRLTATALVLAFGAFGLSICNYWKPERSFKPYLQTWDKLPTGVKTDEAYELRDVPADAKEVLVYVELLVTDHVEKLGSNRSNIRTFDLVGDPSGPKYRLATQGYVARGNLNVFSTTAWLSLGNDKKVTISRSSGEPFTADSTGQPDSVVESEVKVLGYR
jgi:hypothetical protein